MLSNIDHDGFVHLVDDHEEQRCPELNPQDVTRLHVFMHNLKVCGMAHQDIIAQGFLFAVEIYTIEVEKQVSETETIPVTDNLSIKERAAALLFEVIRIYFR